jgi:hypothetical protein
MNEHEPFWKTFKLKENTYLCKLHKNTNRDTQVDV